MLDSLDADAIRRWSRTAVESVREHQAEIDALNVFPVPDGDTGTNLVFTLAAADDALRSDDARTGAAALRVLAHAAVLGARGNSGVIVSQLLRGLADTAQGRDAVDAIVIREGLRVGAAQAWQAVADPVEGTILSVARAAAEATPDDGSLAGAMRAVVAAAEDALAHTTEQLQALADAGVVDAGARGYLLLLDALEQVVTGQPSRLAPVAAVAVRAASARAVREAGSDEFDYEVQYLLDGSGDGDSIETLREDLGQLGDCVVVVGTGDGTWNVHVHVNDVGAAVEAGVRAGRPYQIRVVRFSDEDEVHTGASAVVAVGPGDGLAHLFEREGVHVLDLARPADSDVRDALRTSGARDVIVLPNQDTLDACEQAAITAREDGLHVAIVPTRSPVQALAAVAVHDETRRFDDNVVAMAEAAAATRFAGVMVATEQALTSVGICQPGDVLGMIDGEIVEIGHGVLSVVLALSDRLLAVGAELLTVLVGADAPGGIGDLLTKHVRERAPFTEVTVYAAGQSLFPVIIGVE